jgi:hypothetical protein
VDTTANIVKEQGSIVLQVEVRQRIDPCQEDAGLSARDSIHFTLEKVDFVEGF